MTHFYSLRLLLCVCASCLRAQQKTFTREYTYQAGEDDSRNSARANATVQMRNILLLEVGQYLKVEQKLTTHDDRQKFSETIEAITAGIVEMTILEEQWNGDTYYIKAEMTVDPEEVLRRIADVLNDKQKTKELEEARKRTLAAEAEAERLRKELKETKDEQQRLALQATYQWAADALSAEEYFTRGYNAQENGWHEMAIEYYQKAIALDPNDASAYGNMGVAYGNLQDHREAIRCFRKVIAIDPNDAKAYSNMGVAYNGLKDYREAIRCYQKAVEIDPNYARAYYNMGNAYVELQDYREAIRCYQKEIAIDPNKADAYYNMGVAYGNLQDHREAIRCYRKAVAIDPTLAYAYDNMGNAYHNLQDYREAIRSHQKAIAIDPTLANAYYNIGNTYGKVGNTEEQIKNYRQAARLGHEDAQEWLQKNGYTW
jgi:superkiller protein 3